MVDNAVFYEIECIKRMDDNSLLMFKKVFEHYAPKLSGRIIIDGSAFTSHDQYHCLDIYKIISYSLLRGDTSYAPEIGLSRRELFILNLAVLFHDISMSARLGTKRENHSKESAEYVQEEYNNSSSVLKSETDLTINEIRALKAIIKAHSNIKGDASIPREKNGMKSPELTKEYKDYQNKTIRTLFLAGILRLADELDVISDRIGNGTIENEIENGKKIVRKFQEEGNDQELKKWAGFIESEQHWQRLHYIESVSLNAQDKTVIELVVDDEYVEHLLDEGHTEKTIASTLTDIHSKIKSEFEEIKTIAFLDSNVSIYVYAQTVKLVTQNENIRSEIEKAQGIISITIVENHRESIEAESGSCDLGSERKLPSIIDSNLAEKLDEEVRERQLLQFGHFQLNDKYCARDWLDIREIVETRELSKQIVSAMSKHINSRPHDKVVILGMDMVGALLAARVAFELQLPMSYFVSVKNTDYNSEQEIDFAINQDERVIIITESIATFKTLKSTLEKYDIEEKVDSIYTVFYRTTELESEEQSLFIDKTYSINNSFPIELVEKEKCSYKKDDKCFAKNRH